MGSIDLSVDEIVATLKKTSLPTIVVEGGDDAIVYRAFEQQLPSLSASILPAGGRPKVLEVFRRRFEFGPDAKVAYIVDQDVWINTSVPIEFSDARLILTSGYSIENDVILDGDLRRLLRGGEVASFGEELVRFCDWYALALSRHLIDPTKPTSLHPDHVLCPSRHASLTLLEEGEMYPNELRATLASDPMRLVRGKSVLSLLVRHLSYKGRVPRHQSGSLLELVALNPGANLIRIRNEVQAALT